LGACAARDPYVSSVGAATSGNWKIERQLDRITGAPLASALVTTRKSSNSAVPFAQPAMLQISCLDKAPLVRFSFQFKVGADRNSVLGYRFDEKPGHEVEARFLQDSKVVVIEDGAEVARFVNDMATSHLLYVRVRSLNSGRSSAEFIVDGAPAAIDAAFAGCSLEQPARRAQARGLAAGA
jgi:hypothetical protein